MAISWNGQISLGNVLTMVGMGLAVAGFSISFYYKANNTAEKVDDLSLALKEKGEEISQSLEIIDSSIDKVKTDVNVIRIEVTKISSDGQSMQRQIDDIKDELP